MLSAKADPRQDAVSMLHASLTLHNKTQAERIYKILWNGIEGVRTVDIRRNNINIPIITFYRAYAIQQESNLPACPFICVSVSLSVSCNVNYSLNFKAILMKLRRLACHSYTLSISRNKVDWTDISYSCQRNYRPIFLICQDFATKFTTLGFF